MKFLCILRDKPQFHSEDSFYNNFILNFNYDKIKVKNRKKLYKSRPGVSKNIKKDSINRDSNNNLLIQFLNINTKKGKKKLFLKNLNLTVENLFYCFSHQFNDFNFYKNYTNFIFSHNYDSNFSNFNFILKNTTLGLESIFEIKTKKNNKKLKLKEKYSHEISYIPKERRLKYVLKSLSFYKESFKNYRIWERLFWSFFVSIVDKENSFLKKRRDYIYLKSLKFFKKKKNPLK